MSEAKIDKRTALKNDLTGKRFGKLLVIGVSGKRKRVTIWHCVCDCGNEKDVLSNSLVRGRTRSCGCLHREQLAYQNNITKTKHGGSKDRLYPVWLDMNKRCADVENKNYGARGIAVCDEWKDYNTFKKWAYMNGYDGNAPRGACTLDRINNDGDYEPLNCRWTPQATQTLNTRRNILYRYNKEMLPLSEVAKITNIKYSRLYYLTHHGRALEDAIIEARKNENTDWL